MVSHVSRPARPERPDATPQLTFGAFILLIGVVLILDRLEVVSAARSLQYWPVGLIALGVTIVARRRDAHSRFWGLGWIAVGAWMLLHSLGVITVGFWDLVWPLLLIGFGASLVLQALRQRGGVRPATTRATRLFAMLGETKRRVERPFDGAYLTAIMGGCILDLREASIAPGGEQSVEVFGVLAGHDILVPAGWVVVLDVSPMPGHVEDQRVSPVVELRLSSALLHPG